MKCKGNYWHASPRDVAEWWRRRDTSEIRPDKNEEPCIKGPAAKDAVITWIKLVNDEVIFDVEDWKVQRQVKSQTQK